MKSVLAIGLTLLSIASAQSTTNGASSSQATRAIDPNLVGTWTTKSRKVFTGPGVYNPVNDSFIEPALPGISYSFTSDGYYEEVYYRAVENPTNPDCATAILQWQHGEFVQLANNSLILSPYEVDGRQLLSEPCLYPDQGIYTRYWQEEMFLKYEVITDKFHGVKRLNLYEFDGSLMQPMYIAYYPTPQMLPTQTLNPTASGAAATSSAHRKRDMSFEQLPYGRPQLPPQSRLLNPDLWWWIGVGATAFGGVAYLTL